MKNRHSLMLALTLILALGVAVPAGAQTPQPPYRLFLPSVMRAPEIVTLNASADAYVYERDPNTNTGSELYLYAGNDQDEDSPMGVMRSFIRFDLPVLKPEQVKQAVVRLYYAGYADFENQTRTVFLSATPSPWNETTITWANQPRRGFDVSGTVINSNDPFGYVEIYVTDLVWQWLGGFAPNYGLMLQGPESADSDWSYRAFAARESAYPPQLELTLK